MSSDKFTFNCNRQPKSLSCPLHFGQTSVNKKSKSNQINKSDSQAFIYSKDDIHQAILRHLIWNQKSSKLISILHNLSKEELRDQARLLSDYLPDRYYIDWLTREDSPIFTYYYNQQLEDICLSICTSHSSILNKINDLAKEYIRENQIDENSFNYLCDGPVKYDGLTIINHLYNLFNSETDLEVTDFSIDYLQEQLAIFESQLENYLQCSDSYLNDFQKFPEFGKAAFVIFKIVLLINNQSNDEKYKSELNEFMICASQSIKDVIDENTNDDFTKNKFSINDDDTLEDMSSKIFNYFWGR